MHDGIVPGMEHRRTHWRKGLLLLVFLTGLAAYFLLGGHRAFTAENIQENRDVLVGWVEARPVASHFVAALVYTVVVALSIPIASLLTMTAGFLFGLWLGLAVVVVGATAGAALVFLAARYLFRDLVAGRVGPRVAVLLGRFEQDGFTYLLFLRFMPILPFWLLNLAPAITGLRLRSFAAATAVGILPASFVYANLGATLGAVDTPRELLGSDMLIALSLIALLALVPLVWRHFAARRRIHKEQT